MLSGRAVGTRDVHLRGLRDRSEPGVTRDSVQNQHERDNSQEYHYTAHHGL